MDFTRGCSSVIDGKRVYFRMICWKRQVQRKNGAGSLHGMNIAGSTQARGTLVYAQQAQTFCLMRVKALAIVQNRQNQTLVFLLYFDPNCSCLGMARAIVKRFLDHSIDTGTLRVG